MLAWAVAYAILVRQPMPCGNNVHGSSNVTFHCYETTGESHFVEFLDKSKADKFFANLSPHNLTDVFDPRVADNKRFISRLELHSFKEINGEWKDITPKE
jgi:hypothetical protein